MDLARRDDDRHSYAEYLTWNDGQRWELIDGIAYAMSPAPTPRHQRFVLELAAQLLAATRDGPCQTFVAPIDVRLAQPATADDDVITVVQPDVLVVCGEKVDERGIVGAPDFIIEVLSPSTASHDHIRKRRAYEAAGVRELWLVHPVDCVLTRYLRVGGGFSPAEFLSLNQRTDVTVLERASIDWSFVQTLSVVA